MGQGKKMTAVLLIACLMVMLLPSGALAAPTYTYPNYPVFVPGDTSAAGRKAFSGTDPYAISWEWTLTDSSGKFELYSGASAASATSVTQSGKSSTVYVGVKPGAVLTASDINQAFLHSRIDSGGSVHNTNTFDFASPYSPPSHTYSPDYPTYIPGDTSAAGRYAITSTQPYAIRWEWTLTDTSGKFELYDSATGAAVTSVTQSGPSSTVYVGVKPGAVVAASDQGQATLNLKSWYSSTYSHLSTFSINVYTPGSSWNSDSMPLVSAARIQATETKLDNLKNTASNMSAADILDAMEAIFTSDPAALISAAMYSTSAQSSIDMIETAYLNAIGLGGGNASATADAYAQGVFGLLNSGPITNRARGAIFNADASTASLELQFSQPATPNLTGETAGIQYDTGTMVPVDIKLIKNGTDEIHGTKVPVMITVPIPAGINADNTLEVLHQTSGGTWERLPSQTIGSECSFFTDDFSVFVFVNRTGYTSSGGSKDTPVPIVPVIYDIAKAGDDFTFKVLIANANSRMPGATITVKLNDRYSTAVTIGEDGVGTGTINTQGFAGNTAYFSAWVNGTGARITKPMIVTSSGKVIPR